MPTDDTDLIAALRNMGLQTCNKAADRLSVLRIVLAEVLCCCGPNHETDVANHDAVSCPYRMRMEPTDAD